MKIVFLNTLNGQIRQPITDFIRQHMADTDIFCFQEAYDEMKFICREILASYQEISDFKFISKDDNFPQATYLRPGLQIISSGSILKNTPAMGLGVYVEIRLEDSSLYVCNVHGIARPGDKLDNPGRLGQSEELIKFFADKTQVIIGGDFNLLPETKSVQVFEEHGYINLIKDFGIKTTRNKHAWDLNPDNKQLFSDYVFVSPSLKIEEFTVPNNEISDHLSLIVKFRV